MPQIKEEARECSPGEPASKECTAEGKGDKGDSDWECAREKEQGSLRDCLGHSWRLGGTVFPPHLHVEKSQVRKKSATLLQKSLLSSSIQD